MESTAITRSWILIYQPREDQHILFISIVIVYTKIITAILINMFRYVTLVTFYIFLMTCCLSRKTSASSSSSVAVSISEKEKERGPFFVIDLPSQILFSNSSGTVVTCNAIGSSSLDSRLIHRDNLRSGQDSSPPDLASLSISFASSPSVGGGDGEKTSQPHLHPHHSSSTSFSSSPSFASSNSFRHIRSDGSLLSTPLGLQSIRPDVHSSAYLCVASNSQGSIISREVNVNTGENHATLFSFPFSSLSSRYSLFCPSLFSCSLLSLLFLTSLPLLSPSPLFSRPLLWLQKIGYNFQQTSFDSWTNKQDKLRRKKEEECGRYWETICRDWKKAFIFFSLDKVLCQRNTFDRKRKCVLWSCMSFCCRIRWKSIIASQPHTVSVLTHVYRPHE